MSLRRRAPTASCTTAAIPPPTTGSTPATELFTATEFEPTRDSCEHISSSSSILSTWRLEKPASTRNAIRCRARAYMTMAERATLLLETKADPTA